jgi:hypothetical protein
MDIFKKEKKKKKEKGKWISLESLIEHYGSYDRCSRFKLQRLHEFFIFFPFFFFWGGGGGV